MRRRTRDHARFNALRRRPALEALEARTVLSTFTVTNLNDHGPGSLAHGTQRGVDPLELVLTLEQLAWLDSGRHYGSIVGDARGRAMFRGRCQGVCPMCGASVGRSMVGAQPLPGDDTRRMTR